MTTKNIFASYIRNLEIVCISLFIFGFLWSITEILNLTVPQFFMLYGGSGALVCEMLYRLSSKKKI